MEYTGKIINIGEIQTVGQNWLQKRTVVLEESTDKDYKGGIAFDLIKDKVNNEVKKGIRELEHTLNNTSRSNDGNLKFVSGVNDDTDSIISKGWNLDIE